MTEYRGPQRYLRFDWGDLSDMPDLSAGQCQDGDGKVAHFQAQGVDGDSRNVSPRDVAAAKAWCRACPVEVECGTWAISKEDYPGAWDGIYGGLDAADRAARGRQEKAA